LSNEKKKGKKIQEPGGIASGRKRKEKGRKRIACLFPFQKRGKKMIRNHSSRHERGKPGRGKKDKKSILVFPILRQIGERRERYLSKMGKSGTERMGKERGEGGE